MISAGQKPTNFWKGCSLAEAEELITPGGAPWAEAPAPEPEPTNGATGSRLRTFEIHTHSCSTFHLPGESGCDIYELRLFGGEFLRWTNGAERLDLPPLRCAAEIPKNSWRTEVHIELQSPDWHPPYVVHKGEGKQLIAYCHYGITFGPVLEIDSLSGSFSLVDFVYPNGFQEGQVRELEPRVLEE